MFEALKKTIGQNADLALVILTVGILVVLFTPIHPRLLDLLLLLNLSFALLVLLLTFYMQKPVQFSTFPSLLLIATLFRLALNIAATRLILADADAGRVIGAIGSFVVGGNYVIGLIVFLILVVIQYVVVTNGAQRVAEVAARFTLDSMPGQQMSIDADLNMGFIDQAEAQQRRKNLEKEANFYGAMDGASKFVKGDAIAGIIILLINMLGGWAIGVMQQGMPWDEALRTFTLLTIGDGIVTQVPALVIALGTGIIVTRSASDEGLSSALLKQLVSFPKTLLMVLSALFILLWLPGIPAVPTAALMLLFGVVAYFSYRRSPSATAAASQAESSEETKTDEDVYGLLTVEPIEIKVGSNLVGLINAEDSVLIERLTTFRKSYAQEGGFVLPKIRIRDDKKLPPNSYEILAYGLAVAQAEIVPERILAIHPQGDITKIAGVATRDPTYQLPALWILDAQRAQARQAGYTLVEPLTVFITHLSEVLRQQAAVLLSRMETERLINHFRKSHAGLVEELIPTVLTLGEVQKILQNLLKEKISIRNLELILEVLVDQGRQSKDPDYLTELVRQKLGAVICQSLSSGNGLQVLTLDPAIEQTITSNLRATDEKSALVLDPKFAEQLLSRLGNQVERMIQNNTKPVLLCAPELRRHLRRLTERLLPQLAIVSMAEIPNSVNLHAFGMVTI